MVHPFPRGWWAVSLEHKEYGSHSGLVELNYDVRTSHNSKPTTYSLPGLSVAVAFPLTETCFPRQRTNRHPGYWVRGVDGSRLGPRGKLLAS